MSCIACFAALQYLQWLIATGVILIYNPTSNEHYFISNIGLLVVTGRTAYFQEFIFTPPVVSEIDPLHNPFIMGVHMLLLLHAFVPCL